MDTNMFDSLKDNHAENLNFENYIGVERQSLKMGSDDKLGTRESLESSDHSNREKQGQHEEYAMCGDTNLLGQPKWNIISLSTTFIGLGLGMLLVCSAETIANMQMVKLKALYDSTISSVWLEAGFLLTCVMIQPIYIKLAEEFGRVRPLYGAMAIFIVFSIVIGAANSMELLVAGRVLQGIGGAGIMPLTLVVLTDITTISQRGVWINFLGMAIILGKWTGPMLGALAYENSLWRWSYYAPAIIGAVTVVFMYFTLDKLPKPPSNGSPARGWKDFDILGIITWCIGSVMFLSALVLGGNEFEWSSAIVVCLLVFGLLIVAGFFFIEWKVASWPMIPLKTLRTLRSWLCLVASFFAGMCMYTSIFFIPYYYSTIHSYDGSKAGLQLMWYILGGCVGSLMAGFITSRFGHYYYLNLSGLGLLIIGNGLNYRWDQTNQKVYYPACQVISGLGLGLCIQQMLLAAQVNISPVDIATVTTMVDYARTFGGMVGLIIGESLLKNQIYNKVVPTLGDIPLLNLRSTEKSHSEKYTSLKNIDFLSVGKSIPAFRAAFPEVIEKALIEGAEGFSHITLVNIISAGIAFILCLFIKQITQK
ncbi:hypothetical protein H4219_002947 [Mycoemilia scoparia]|uniref:Major facilitator superfamily (MFS) profile domain-containing protein n=1 Tax=Mycoemilia scoparia TaxID=417184 RepID=A0A9W7ZW88_9FUNG|nr:hypothetical protein H4219_002947 [Mycoemilia scoparia]